MPTRRRNWIRWAVFPLCFASGVAGLSYELVWHRLLAVVLGNASFATAAVLAAVMGGMGAGALVVGRYADRTDALRLYGALELALGVTALAVPSLATFADAWSLPVLSAIGPGWGSFAVRFVIASAVVLVPAFFLGATLPALVKAVEARSPGQNVGQSVGVVYALNTAGAALGCAVTGYLALGAFGVRATNLTAALIDIAVGSLALGLAYVGAERADETHETTEVETSATGAPKDHGPVPLRERTVLGLAFVAGFVVLGLETIWTRFFLLVFGHDVHAFTAMLTSVLIGLAIGAALYRLAPPALRNAPRLVHALFVALGAVAILSLSFTAHRYVAGGLDILGVDASLSITRSHERGIVLQAIFAALTVLPTAIIAGAIFPALVGRHPATAKAGQAYGAGERTGRVLFANTVGTISGPLMTTLVLVPVVGIIAASLALACLAGAGAIAGLLTEGPGPRRGGEATAPRRGLVPALGAALLLALAFLSLPTDMMQRVLAQKIGPSHVSFELYEEGRSATVAVVTNQINGERQIFVNGINEVTTRLVHDQSFELLGHLGLLLHPDPDDVAVICLGGGLAAGAVTRHDVEEITIVDLEPAVELAARAFEELNHYALDDPRVTLVIDDGRAHLRTTEGRYDVVVLDSTHPRAVDSWILYTREFYQTAQRSLREDGVLVQWLPLHGLSADEFRIIVGTFVETFPETTLWTNVGFEPYGQTAYSLLVATQGGAAIDAGRIEARLQDPAVAAALTPWGLGTTAEVLECLHAGPETLLQWTRGLPINTDDLPLTQFVTDYTDGAPMTPDRLLEAFAPAPSLLAAPPAQSLADALTVRWRAQGLLLAGALERAQSVCPECAKVPMFVAAMAEGADYYEELGQRYAGDDGRLLEVAAGLALHGRRGRAVEILEVAAEAHSDPTVLIHLGLLRAAGGDLEGAADAYRAALYMDEGRALARTNLGRVYLELGQVDAGTFELERAVAADPMLAEAHAALGYARMQRPARGGASGGGRTDAGPEGPLQQALLLDPRQRSAYVSLGRLFLRQQRYDEAREVLARGLAYHPYDADLLFNLAVVEERRGNSAAARAHLERLLFVDPGDEEASDALAALAGSG
ncbi:MAG: fused MFS/spermidine synthase [Deltaproteobacteria bacterium]|nr:fused MFS/spermidine synthase [Deltaproteobacteria bacterium]